MSGALKAAREITNIRISDSRTILRVHIQLRVVRVYRHYPVLRHVDNLSGRRLAGQNALFKLTRLLSYTHDNAYRML